VVAPLLDAKVCTAVPTSVVNRFFSALACRLYQILLLPAAREVLLATGISTLLLAETSMVLFLEAQVRGLGVEYLLELVRIDLRGRGGGRLLDCPGDVVTWVASTTGQRPVRIPTCSSPAVDHLVQYTARRLEIYPLRWLSGLQKSLL